LVSLNPNHLAYLKIPSLMAFGDGLRPSTRGWVADMRFSFMQTALKAVEPEDDIDIMAKSLARNAIREGKSELQREITLRNLRYMEDLEDTHRTELMRSEGADRDELAKRLADVSCAPMKMTETHIHSHASNFEELRQQLKLQECSARGLLVSEAMGKWVQLRGALQQQEAKMWASWAANRQMQQHRAQKRAEKRATEALQDCVQEALHDVLRGALLEAVQDLRPQQQGSRVQAAPVEAAASNDTSQAEANTPSARVPDDATPLAPAPKGASSDAAAVRAARQKRMRATAGTIEDMQPQHSKVALAAPLPTRPQGRPNKGRRIQTLRQPPVGAKGDLKGGWAAAPQSPRAAQQLAAAADIQLPALGAPFHVAAPLPCA